MLPKPLAAQGFSFGTQMSLGAPGAFCPNPSTVPVEGLTTKPPAGSVPWYCIWVVREGQPTHPTNVKLNQTKMTVDFSKDVMLGMLRKGATGNQILDILDVIVPNQTELTREQVCEDLAIADCPENDDEIEAYLAAV